MLAHWGALLTYRLQVGELDGYRTARVRVVKDAPVEAADEQAGGQEGTA